MEENFSAPETHLGQLLSLNLNCLTEAWIPLWMPWKKNWTDMQQIEIGKLFSHRGSHVGVAMLAFCGQIKQNSG